MDALTTGIIGLADYACQSRASRGRFFPEPPSPTRSQFQRDRDRIVHSTAFRRLKHKTQVFVHHEGDLYRTRLTHSIEVSQIARALARAFRVDEDLAEALALSHDFGHTPFGHTGEDALDEMMRQWGGFDHNAQSLKIVTSLEQRYAEFDGLNLTWETLEGLVKHNGPLIGPLSAGARLPAPIQSFNAQYDLDLARHSALEAQCAAIADDIAYNAHDLDDGLRAGLFALEDLRELPLAGEILSMIETLYPSLDPARKTHEVVRRQITAMVEDVIGEAQRRLGELQPANDADFREAGRAMVAFSQEMAAAEKAIKAFLYARMYRAPSIRRIRENASQIVADLFGAYFNGDADLPQEWGTACAEHRAVGNDEKIAGLVADFIAGMTDRYAVKEHQRLFDATPELR